VQLAKVGKVDLAFDSFRQRT